jgi:uncharacterized protein with PIN domain
MLVTGALAFAASGVGQEVVADGLNNPMGLLAMPDGSVWVVDSGVGGNMEIEAINPQTGEPATATVGNTSRVLRIAPDGTTSVRATLPSISVGQEFIGGGRLARLGTHVYATSGAWLDSLGPEPMPLMAAVLRVDTASVELTASTWAIEEEENAGGFVLDTHLGTLARYLRLCGFDTLYRNDYDDEELAGISAGQHRILLTRDRDVLKRRIVTHGCFVRNDRPREQLVEVLQRFHLTEAITPFTRCTRCNGRLQEVAKEDIADRLEPLTRRYYQRFRQCTGCGRIYWRGSHVQHIERLIGRIREDLRSRA